MSRRNEPTLPKELLDPLLTGADATAALNQGGLLDTLKMTLAERALNAEMDHYLEQTLLHARRLKRAVPWTHAARRAPRPG